MQACSLTLAEIRELLLLRQTDNACFNDVQQRTFEKICQPAAKNRATQAISAALDGLIVEYADTARR
ncbi:hypothetical protein D3C71_1798210 [compost metagenome]